MAKRQSSWHADLQDSFAFCGVRTDSKLPVISQAVPDFNSTTLETDYFQPWLRQPFSYCLLHEEFCRTMNTPLPAPALSEGPGKGELLGRGPWGLCDKHSGMDTRMSFLGCWTAKWSGVSHGPAWGRWGGRALSQAAAGTTQKLWQVVPLCQHHWLVWEKPEGCML